jgi:hypothetical protein
MRIICGGTIIEDVDNYNRVHELFHQLSSTAKRQNDAILGFNTATVDDLYNLDRMTPMSRNIFDYTGISNTKEVMFIPLSGLVNQDKYLPLRYMGGLTLEFELVSDPTECLISAAYMSGATNAYPSVGAPLIPAVDVISVLAAANLATAWTLSDIQIKCDVIQLDNNLNDEYVKYLLSGKALAINYNTYVSQYQTVNGVQNSINITRSLSRLKSIFVSHMGPLTPTDSILHKNFNTFFHPMSQTMITNDTASGSFQPESEMEWQIQIGSRLFPEYSVRSCSESYDQL